MASVYMRVIPDISRSKITRKLSIVEQCLVGINTFKDFRQKRGVEIICVKMKAKVKRSMSRNIFKCLVRAQLHHMDFY